MNYEKYLNGLSLRFFGIVFQYMCRVVHGRRYNLSF